MDVTIWRQHSRHISRRSAREFYDGTLAQTHVFLFETARLELPPHGGGFSLKLALSGTEDYLIGRRTVRIEPGSLLMINAGETYGSRIQDLTRSLSLFFTAKDVAAAGAAIAIQPARALDVHDSDAAAVPEVPQIRFKAARQVWQWVAELVHRLDQRQYDAADETAAALLFGALGQIRGLLPPTPLRQVRKRTTRDELIGRLMRARQYIEDVQGEQCSLDRLATVACLSRFHFLRLFKDLFGVGPAAYARARRLRRVEADIAAGESEDIAALRAGYANRYALRRALSSCGRCLAEN